MAATLALRPVQGASPGGAGATRFRQMRIAAVVAYVVVSIASVLWAFPRGGMLNALGARVDAGQQGDGAVLLSIRNDGRIAWTDVQVVADARYTAQTASVEVGGRFDIRMREMRNRDQFLRPPGMFFWDADIARPPPGLYAPPSYRPREIELRTAQGTVTVQLAP